jgi:hypothetical protein
VLRQRGEEIFQSGVEESRFATCLFQFAEAYQCQHQIAAGQNIKYLQNQLGHLSIKVTLDVYGQLFVNKMKAIWDGKGVIKILNLLGDALPKLPLHRSPTF